MIADRFVGMMNGSERLERFERLERLERLERPERSVTAA
jgi:hypothetical protein